MKMIVSQPQISRNMNLNTLIEEMIQKSLAAAEKRAQEEVESSTERPPKKTKMDSSMYSILITSVKEELIVD